MNWYTLASPGDWWCRLRETLAWGVIANLYATMLSPFAIAQGHPGYDSMPYQHCVWQCRVAHLHGQEFALEQALVKATVDLAIFNLAETFGSYCWSRVSNPLRNAFAGHCCSAVQFWDFIDNALETDCGFRCETKNIRKCEGCCVRFGYSCNTAEGLGTWRPYGTHCSPRHLSQMLSNRHPPFDWPDT